MSALLPFARLQRLRQTWAFAREHTAHYARVLPDVPADRVLPHHLLTVPVLTSKEYAPDPWRFRTRSGPPVCVGTSGGTTGRPKLVPAAPADEVLTSDRPDGVEPRPLVLRSTGGAQGSVVGAVDGLLALPFQSAHNYALAWELLTRVFDFPGFTSRIVELGLPLPALKQLVHFALDRELDGSRLALRRIATYAWHLSPAWEKLIESVLGTPVEMWYGFSEALGIMARRCATCGHFHYEDQAWWEVVDPDDHAPVTEGVGLLLVTTLVPYVRDVLLFRYSPGDLVALGPVCPVQGEAGFRVLGRQEKCVRLYADGRSWWVLAPVDVQDFLDTQPWVARIANLRHSGVTATQDDAFPKWCWEVDDEPGAPRLRVRVEVKGNPRFFRETWRALAEGLRAHLLASNVDLARLVARGHLHLEIEGLSAGSLHDRDVVLC